MLACGVVVSSIHSHHALGLGLPEMESKSMCASCGGQESLVGFSEVVFSHVADAFLEFIIEVIGVVCGLLNGFVVFDASLRLVPHQGVSVPESDLRGDEIRVDLERRTVVIECLLELA